ncbi:MAG: hypothetical protein EAZ07_04295 [Cytophagales bacterium]|nr:MAG: hypothetical protein EAZ07_04295 [Cytophagales bacterium]
MQKIAVLSYIQFFVGVFFAGIGLFYVIFPESLDILSPMITRIIGLMFFLRGIFRIFMIYKSEFKKNV